MDRLSDRVRFPPGPYLKKLWKSLISGVFCYLVERKNAVLNRFKLGSEWKKLGSKLGSKSKRKSFEKSMVLECFGVLQIKNDNIRLKYLIISE